jgi:hypothetical protein
VTTVQAASREPKPSFGRGDQYIEITAIFRGQRFVQPESPRRVKLSSAIGSAQGWAAGGGDHFLDVGRFSFSRESAFIFFVRRPLAGGQDAPPL